MLLSGVPDPLGLLALEVPISGKERPIPSSFSPAGRTDKGWEELWLHSNGVGKREGILAEDLFCEAKTERQR